jgi:citrate synthase
MSSSSSTSSSTTPLVGRLTVLVPQRRAELTEAVKKHGEVVLGSVTVSQAVGGARDVPCIYWGGSLLDKEEGVRFQGLTIPQIRRALPAAAPGGEPLPEGLLWLLLTAEPPTPQQARGLTEELHRRSSVPAPVLAAIRAFPRTMHPMTQLASAVLALQPDSHFARVHNEGVSKGSSALWLACLEDVLDLIARLPVLAAAIYRHTFHDDKPGMPYDSSLDYAANFARLLGFRNAGFDEAMRLYLTLHADHEGGNVSAHTTRLVGSALSDPYLSFSAAMCGLAGPLHGRANQEVMTWVLNLRSEFASKGLEVNARTIEDFAWRTLKGGNVIPGYGHSVLRVTDPRYTAQREFCLRHMPDDPLFKIVSTIYEVVPGVLKSQGKTRNPWPNVDAHSGVLLTHYGLHEHHFYTVLFGVSRALGVLSQLFWDRALGLALERPKSINLDSIRRAVEREKEKQQGVGSGSGNAGASPGSAVAGMRPKL